MLRRILVLVLGFGSLAAQAQPQADSLEVMFRSGRSVPVAFGLSVVVPGAGQAYNRHWLKSAAALAAEATVIALHRTWLQQGRDGRTAYQAQVHRNWSPLRYAYWLNDYVQYLNQLPDGRMIDAAPVAISADLYAIDLTQPDGWTDRERLQVRELVLDIRRLEGAAYHGLTGVTFSHKLPFFAEQQYYELVGKYYQYAPGWSDYQALARDGRPTWIDDSGQFIDSIDPDVTTPDGGRPFVSRSFFAYAEQHAAANTLLRRARRVSSLLIVNHLLAALDAAIFARLHNLRLDARVQLIRDADHTPLWAPAVRLRM
ncbi:MAG: hypothetical protein OXM02_10355 [Bacteroidota bacterium]|nr:hypothetical protein [Bacteroidota bacterium]MDE2834907.1 hypothetical protein [Bacteroidota bacterium]